MKGKKVKDLTEGFDVLANGFDFVLFEAHDPAVLLDGYQILVKQGCFSYAISRREGFEQIFPREIKISGLSSRHAPACYQVRGKSLEQLLTELRMTGYPIELER